MLDGLEKQARELAEGYFGEERAIERAVNFGVEFATQVRQKAIEEQWVSVEERLPEPQQPVMFVAGPKSGDYAGHVLGGKFVNESWGFSTPGMGYDATHWQPLPAAPLLDAPPVKETKA